MTDANTRATLLATALAALLTSCASAPEFRCNGRLVVDDATGTYTCEAGERQ